MRTRTEAIEVDPAWTNFTPQSFALP